MTANGFDVRFVGWEHLSSHDSREKKIPTNKEPVSCSLMTWIIYDSVVFVSKSIRHYLCRCVCQAEVSWGEGRHRRRSGWSWWDKGGSKGLYHHWWHMGWELKERKSQRGYVGKERKMHKKTAEMWNVRHTYVSGEIFPLRLTMFSADCCVYTSISTKSPPKAYTFWYPT